MKWNVLVLLLLFVFASNDCIAQIGNDEKIGPKNGLNRLAISYYGIEFEEQQKELIKGRKIELIYEVDALGKPILQEVNGIQDPIVIDSFYQKTSQLDPFFIRDNDGEPQSYIYFLQLQFPEYEVNNRMYYSSIREIQLFRNSNVNDFESIQYARSGMDIYFGGIFNSYMNDNLGFGGGMDIDMNYVWDQKYLFGLNMVIHGNKRNQNFNIPVFKEQDNFIGSISLGGHFGKKINRNTLQVELNWSAMNVITKKDQFDFGYQTRGWSTGLIYLRSIPIGSKKPSFLYGSPVITQHNLTLSGAIKYMSFGLKEASGLLLEVGLGYLLEINEVKSYEIKSHLYN